MSNLNEYHESQVAKDGCLRPRWPGASHFKDWHFAPFEFEGKKADLYFWCSEVNHSGHTYPELLIGIQTSSEGGDYMSPFIEEGNALNKLYLKGHRNDVLAAYLIACTTLGIKPSFKGR